MSPFDTLVNSANAGDAAAIATLGNLPVQDWPTAGVKLTRPGLTIRFNGGGLIPPLPTPSNTAPGVVFEAVAPGVSVDGVTVRNRCGIFWHAWADGQTISNITLPTCSGAVVTLGNTIDTGGTNLTITNLRMTGECDQSVIFISQNGAVLNNVVSLGSPSENGIRIDTPAGTFGQPSVTINGGVFRTTNTYGKSTMTCRTGNLTLNGVTIFGNLGMGEVYQEGQKSDGNFLLPGGKLANISPGFYASVTINDSQFFRNLLPSGQPDPNGEACINANEGTILAANRCNFSGCGPYPHSLPIAVWGSTATAVATDCTVNAPSVGAPGGVMAPLFPAGSAGTESGTRWFSGTTAVATLALAPVGGSSAKPRQISPPKPAVPPAAAPPRPPAAAPPQPIAPIAPIAPTPSPASAAVIIAPGVASSPAGKIGPSPGIVLAAALVLLIFGLH